MALRETVKIIFDIIHDLANAPNGLSRGEIVAKYRIGASTAHKYIRLIEDMGLPIYTEGQRYFIERSYFVELKLTSEEGEFLFLALERALTTHTRQSFSARSLIHKLALKLHPHLTGELQDQFRSAPGNTTEARIFTTLTQAKRRRREVWVDYLPLNRSDASRWRIRPYRFVSNPLSDGFYVLCDGSRDGEAAISLSLKFDRILDARLTNERFEIADLARFQSHYGQSWGVWSSEGEPVSVVLRFEPRHYDRLLESNWHPTQTIHSDADGYVIFRVKVSAPQEMTPWIRSWGSGVVVEEPPELRQRLIHSVLGQARQYGLELETDADDHSLLYRLWAKREPKGKPRAETTHFHLLIYHLLDVAAVAESMWDQTLSEQQRAWLQERLGLEAAPARQLLALLAGLHDIGKATPDFQKKALDLYAELGDGLRERSDNAPHGSLSAVILKRWLKDKGIDLMRAGQLAAVIGGHHGDWITSAEMYQASAGKAKWQDLQAEICRELEEVLGAGAVALPPKGQDFNTFAAFVAGFVSVCDWIGSYSAHFPFEARAIDLREYLERSRQRAQTALDDLGFRGWRPDEGEPDFNSVFEFEPNELQSAGIAALCPLCQAPRLVLVEYPTGGGKTELALHIADLLINRYRLGGSYIAMPTQATSNQMFERVGKYLQRRYPKQSINFHLIHGQAEQQKAYQQIQPQPEREGNESRLTAEDWFQNRKRALLAPFGVGTIDQAMLSVLQAKHHFVRQFALSQKLVIFDEIHSYDSYMNVIIERLFAWLQALNSPMILLSATLSRQGRREILNAVGARNLEAMDEAPYPRLTVVEHSGRAWTRALPKPETRSLAIEALPADDGSLLDAILPRYQQGGCIAVVCNSVDESIAVARFLRATGDIDAKDVWLFHARYPPLWRRDIEEEVLSAFGKDAERRPERAILVATQIIEQSLDLDFDLMISRTAPIDLLIQRVGRLHRHERADRPAHLAQPTLLWRAPVIGEDRLPSFGVDEVIYQRFFLLKTWLMLRDTKALRTPDDVDKLMDFVYSEDCEHVEFSDALRAAKAEMKLDETNSAFRGAQYVIGEPGVPRLIGRRRALLPDDEERHVATRSIRPGIDVICIADESLQELLERVPSKDDIAALLRHKVTIRDPRVKAALVALPEHANWAKTPQLRYARPLIFQDHGFKAPDCPYRLRLTQEYGLEIIDEEAE